jgi:hypothetical protein
LASTHGPDATSSFWPGPRTLAERTRSHAMRRRSGPQRTLIGAGKKTSRRVDGGMKRSSMMACWRSYLTPSRRCAGAIRGPYHEEIPAQSFTGRVGSPTLYSRPTCRSRPSP